MDTSKYCSYHDAKEHHTADCRQLKDEIEALTRKGKLTEWVIKEVRKHRTDYHTVPHPHCQKAMDRDSMEAKDKPLINVNHLSLRPLELFENEADEVVFKENDAKWVHYPHSDALVIKIKIGRVNVHQALVDNRSSTDVLTYDAYKKLGLLDRELTSTGGHLYGFTGNSIRVKGTIRLPVTLGKEPCMATQIVIFTVVDQPCAYNIIMGRPHMSAIRMALRAAQLWNTSKETVNPGESDVLMKEAEGRKIVRPEGHETCNMISFEELPEGYFENMGI
ncbi:uncharacterized protein LOC141690961 [Apium graveolens]|uniref:uncharacterized protein LOC141690961 n=1 Tax=Apium graveolens TaxID=4045 RepID=UPI003D7BF411